MPDLENLMSVIYRTGELTVSDYWEAVEDLTNAARQMEPDGRNCTVCHDSGHQAFECRHNPLRMVRKLIAESEAEKAKWRCFHCAEEFTDYESAREHFGKNQEVVPACLRNALCPVTLTPCAVQRSNAEHCGMVREARRTPACNCRTLGIGG